MKLEPRKEVLPFLKWAGGKRWLVSKYYSIFPSSYNRYIEPFLGSGAVFFKLQPSKSILSDINKELIETFMALRVDWKKVVKKLKEHHEKHSKDYYYKIRRSEPSSIYDRAAWLIYLNRTCWNGLYRVNLKGEFNVPMGTKTNVTRPKDDFSAVSRLLQKAEIIHSDFESIIERAQERDLLFIDPPYSVKHGDNGFVKYNEELFSWDDQVRLRDSLVRARERGAYIIMTNVPHRSVKDLYSLYREYFEYDYLVRGSLIAADASKRGAYRELIFKGLK